MLWLSYGSAMAQLWLSYGSAMAQLWLSYGSAMAQLWLSYAIAMRLLCDCYAIAMRLLCLSYDRFHIGNADRSIIADRNGWRGSLRASLSILLRARYCRAASALRTCRPMGLAGRPFLAVLALSPTICRMA